MNLLKNSLSPQGFEFGQVRVRVGFALTKFWNQKKNNFCGCPFVYKRAINPSYSLYHPAQDNLLELNIFG
jgi:hypothetical protein